LIIPSETCVKILFFQNVKGNRNLQAFSTGERKGVNAINPKVPLNDFAAWALEGFQAADGRKVQSCLSKEDDGRNI
jgi:hypothetical protein